MGGRYAVPQMWGQVISATAMTRIPFTRYSSPLLTRSQTGQGRCLANLHKWGLANLDLCPCGQLPTMNRIVDLYSSVVCTCPLTKFEGGLQYHSVQRWRRRMHTAAEERGNYSIREMKQQLFAK